MKNKGAASWIYIPIDAKNVILYNKYANKNTHRLEAWYQFCMKMRLMNPPVVPPYQGGTALAGG